MMEVVFLAGCYQTMAMLTKTFGMQLEGAEGDVITSYSIHYTKLYEHWRT